ncbi:MAG: DUF4143 domain-containing protein [Chlorobi bacterium]|nr:DUF4143 domain-containing protein [Chlorobiota bacterium]
MAEQFVGQEILSAIDEELFYWYRNSKSSNAEINFLISLKDKIIPIEVKRGPAGKLISLHLFLKTYSQITFAYVLSGSQFAELSKEKIVFLPLYYAYSLAKNLGQ